MKSTLKTYAQSDNRAFPVRLGGLKEHLLVQANETDSSLHYHIRKILQKHVEESKGVVIKFKRVRRIEL